MKKRLISLCLVFVFIGAVYIFANKYEYADSLEQKESLQRALALDFSESMKGVKEVKTNDMVLSLEENDPIEKYYGTYEITEFWPTLHYCRGLAYDELREQEADMMLGHIVEIKEESLVTYECFRWNGVYDGILVRRENYRIEKVFIENPQYEWESIDANLTSIEEYTGRLRDSFPCVSEFENCREKICGRITVTVEDPYVQEYYVMEDGIMMYSTMTGEYFYLKKLDEKPDKAMPVKELSEEEKEKIIQEVYGNYTITEFLPTKFYPALESGGDVLLPQGEADMMIGKEIAINRQLFTTYDNGRLPNSEAANRLMDEYLLEEIEITTPDYQIERKCRDDIYGLRDDMLPAEMLQEEYIEINVFPGYGELPFTAVLPQMYLLNDGRLLLYAMGEYFLLEKNKELPEIYYSILNLEELMSELQKVYIQKDFWYNTQSIDFYIRNQGYTAELQPTDLEQVTFYLDIKEEEIYFSPSNRDEMFRFYKKEVNPRRSIIPEPDTSEYVVYQTDITEIKDRLIELGTIVMPFPDNEKIESMGWAKNDLTYNEYMQAVEDMIHGTLKDEGEYGNFDIYIEEYEMTDFTNPYEEELGKTAIYIGAAVVCLDDGYGYCCNFLASDLLPDGNVEIFYHVPPTVNVWEEFVSQMRKDNRIVISLTVSPDDEIEVPYNPYPFVMLPILNYAVGEGKFPEDAIYTETMIFY